MRIRLFILIIVCININFAFSKQKHKASMPNSKEEMFNVFDINKITMTVKNNGLFAEYFHGDKWQDGFKYENINFIYSSGLWIAALVNDSARAAISMFGSSDFTHGIINNDGNHYGENDSSKFRVYKIQKGDTPFTNPDYAEWLIDFGAPTDNLGDPLILGDQTLWCTFADSYESNRWFNPTPPLKAELHLTVWGWKDIENAVFLNWKIMNKSNHLWKDAYVGFFVDQDVGSASDDLVGSDSTLNMVYSYESEKGYPNKTLQSIGYVLLETPTKVSPGDSAITLNGWVRNYKNVPAASPLMYKHSPWEWSENMFWSGEYTHNLVYDRLNCRDKYGNSMIDPITGKVSKWAFYGDPVMNLGWIDDFPHDRRMMISAGPFDVAAGDTNSFTLAIIANKSENRLQSVITLKNETSLIKSLFNYQFKIRAKAYVDVVGISSDLTKVFIKVPITSENAISNIQAEFYNYDDELIHSIRLFDDGAHFDEKSTDQIFGNVWETNSINDVLYMNLVLFDETGNRYNLNRIKENIVISNKLRIKGVVVADHINFDGRANPGENVRVSLEVKNNYDFDIERIVFLPTTRDSLITIRTSQMIIDSLKAGGSRNTEYDPIKQSGYFEFDIPENVPIGYQFLLEIDSYDNQYHHWKNITKITVDSLDSSIYTIKPDHVEGKGDADFTIGIVDPIALKKHVYEISVVDSINEDGDRGFTLFDQTAGKILIENSPPPDNYAYNIPVTDGFKIMKAYLPKGGLIANYFVEIACGHETGFDINIDGSPLLGNAPHLEYNKKIEFEFTNNVDANGVSGTPAGQMAFRYEYPLKDKPTGFFQCPFNAWKIINQERAGRLNVCFEEWVMFSSCDDEWGLNSTLVGGFEKIYIMKSDYDDTGLYYEGKKLNLEEVSYNMTFALNSDTSVVDAGDKLMFEFEIPATSNDKFVFLPTEVAWLDNPQKPSSFELFQNYPNPFNISTVIRFSLNKTAKIKVVVFNIVGQKIIELADKEMPVGSHQLIWDSKNTAGQLVSSGLYFVKLSSDKQTKTIKLLLIR